MNGENIKMKNAKDLKRALDLQIAQKIREFELSTGFMVKSIKIIRDRNDETVEKVTCEVTL